MSLSTVQLRDGSLLYIIGVAPEDEASVYDRVFRRARQTAQISEQTTPLPLTRSGRRAGQGSGIGSGGRGSDRPDLIPDT